MNDKHGAQKDNPTRKTVNKALKAYVHFVGFQQEKAGDEIPMTTAIDNAAVIAFIQFPPISVLRVILSLWLINRIFSRKKQSSLYFPKQVDRTPRNYSIFHYFQTL